MPKNSTYYMDKATQIAALRVTNNSDFREASSLQSFCYTLKFPWKATRQQRTFWHTTQYIFKPLVSRTTHPQFMFLLLRCAAATNYMSRKHNGSKCKLFANYWHHKNCLVTFSTKTTQEVPADLQSLKASIEQETETELFCKWSKPQKFTLDCKC